MADLIAIYKVNKTEESSSIFLIFFTFILYLLAVSFYYS